MKALVLILLTLLSLASPAQVISDGSLPIEGDFLFYKKSGEWRNRVTVRPQPGVLGFDTSKQLALIPSGSGQARMTLDQRSRTPLRPDLVPGLECWLSPESGVVTSVVGGDTLISQWTDASGKGRHATQATDALKPRVATGFNGTSYNAVRFGWLDYDGTNWTADKLVLPSMTARTVIGVVKRSPYGAFASWRGRWLFDSAVVMGCPINTLAPEVSIAGGGYGKGHRVEAAAAWNETGVQSFIWDGGANWQDYRRSWNGASLRMQWVSAKSPGSAITLGSAAASATTGTSTDFNGELAELVIYSRSLTPTEIAAVEQYLLFKYNVSRYAGRVNICFDGNSITAGGAWGGQPASDWTFPTLAALDEADLNKNSKYTGANCAQGGDSWTSMQAQAAAEVDFFIDPQAKKNILVAWEGTNALQSADASAVFDQTAAYCLARKAAGWTVVLLDTMAAGVSQRPAPWNDRRLSYNAILDARWSEIADYFVKASLWQIELADELHPGPVGANQIKTELVPRLRAISE